MLPVGTVLQCSKAINAQPIDRYYTKDEFNLRTDPLARATKAGTAVFSTQVAVSQDLFQNGGSELILQAHILRLFLVFACYHALAIVFLRCYAGHTQVPLKFPGWYCATYRKELENEEERTAVYLKSRTSGVVRA